MSFGVYVSVLAACLIVKIDRSQIHGEQMNNGLNLVQSEYLEKSLKNY